jgi:hypothetical protein
MYRATYMIKWKNKEDKLVAELIERILSSNSFENIFQLTKEPSGYQFYEDIK